MTRAEAVTAARAFGAVVLAMATVHELGPGGVLCLGLGWLMWRDATS